MAKYPDKNFSATLKKIQTTPGTVPDEKEDKESFSKFVQAIKRLRSKFGNPEERSKKMKKIEKGLNDNGIKIPEHWQGIYK